MRLISAGASAWCLTPPQPIASPSAYTTKNCPAGGRTSCGSAVAPTDGANPPSERRLSSATYSARQCCASGCSGSTGLMSRLAAVNGNSTSFIAASSRSLRRSLDGLRLCGGERAQLRERLAHQLGQARPAALRDPALERDAEDRNRDLA